MKIAAFAAALALLLGGLMLAGPGLPEQSGPVRLSSACTSGSKPFARLELVFGSTKREGGSVSDVEWAEFVAGEVTPRFPDGLTVLTGQGQFKSGTGTIVREASRLLLIWYEPSERTEARIEAIRTAYKQRFKQDNTMRADGVSCVRF